jgi:endonuclease YncB( thermonuclease family)
LAGVFAAGTLVYAAPAWQKIAASAPTLSSAPEHISGLTSVQSNGLLNVSGKPVQLAGIELPERSQICKRASNRTWRCGLEAKAAVEKLASGRKLDCVQVSSVNDIAVAKCTSNGRDIGAELVRSGRAFAIADYAAEEQTARDAKTGLWSGDAERPAEWRARVWDEASRRAPGGCPIKGRVRDGAKVYVLPWSQGYAVAKVRETRGDRWFCNEEEAKSSGWSPIERS